MHREGVDAVGGYIVWVQCVARVKYSFYMVSRKKRKFKCHTYLIFYKFQE